MEFLAAALLKWGLTGLIIAAFAESFISPVLPDVILIPLALANPQMAIYYGIIATVVSVLGGFVGYAIGYKWGKPVLHKVIPDKYIDRIQEFADSDHISWTIFLAAMSPIPYKCVSISAGAFRVKWPIFIVASLLGRAKRFFLEAVGIYFFGEAFVRLFHENKMEMLVISLIMVFVVGLLIYAYKRHKKYKPRKINEN